VLVHRVDEQPSSAGTDLIGAVAFVWLALDEPASVAEIVERLADASVDVADVEAELGRLLRAGLIHESDPATHRPPPPADTLPDDALHDVGLAAVYDTTVRIRAASPLAGELRTSLADLLFGTDDGEHRLAPDTMPHHLDVECSDGSWTVRWDGETSCTRQPIDHALYDTLSVLNRHASSTAASTGHTVLHGGSVSIDGCAVVLVGHSGAGKSTLTAALARRGHAYLADEVVAIDEQLRVEAFHRPIGLRRGGAAALGMEIPDGPYESIMPLRTGLTTSDGAPLGVVAVLRRDDTHPDAQITAVAPAQALVQLANQTLGSVGAERVMFGRLDALVRRVRVVELTYSEASHAVTALERLAADLDVAR
jgi:hypothetical protein